ncbi:MAG: DNA cytosine methyltransferase [Moorea sp. SIO4A1]|uniref:DNA cytosine methyltransferase n=1 Tax=Moorena sp. SIO4A1 TaxID=2607835 RepID=UPI00145088FC|nr:DNA cytosine methyltransferase [Moorena sp. SIO4A1]NEQ59560.1 DNA cytosine methyltransferase [Moorena sp. SIO4A1]
MSTLPISALSVCSGILTSCHLAAELAGLEEVISFNGFVENDKFKHQFIKSKIESGEVEGYLFSDLKKYAPRPQYDRIIVGGTPCTDTSIANPYRKGFKGEHSSLWLNFYKLVSQTMPRIIVWENPAGCRFPCESEISPLGEVVGSLASLGYNVQWTTLTGREPGIKQPHRRERVFVFAYPNGIRGLDYEKVPLWDRSLRGCLATLQERIKGSNDSGIQSLVDGHQGELDLRERLDSVIGSWWKKNPFKGRVFTSANSVKDRINRNRSIGDACSVPEAALALLFVSKLIQWQSTCDTLDEQLMLRLFVQQRLEPEDTLGERQQIEKVN